RHTRFSRDWSSDVCSSDLNPRAALCFYWGSMEAQVRVEGRVSMVSDAEADAYFASRPYGSQIGAWASRQSRPLPDRSELEARIRSEERRVGEERKSRGRAA